MSLQITSLKDIQIVNHLYYLWGGTSKVLDEKVGLYLKQLIFIQLVFLGTLILTASFSFSEKYIKHMCINCNWSENLPWAQYCQQWPVHIIPFNYWLRWEAAQCSGYRHKLWSQSDGVWILTPLPVSCVTLLNALCLRFPNGEMGDKNHTYFMRLLWRLNELIYVKHLNDTSYI